MVHITTAPGLQWHWLRQVALMLKRPPFFFRCSGSPCSSSNGLHVRIFFYPSVSEL
ncbi:hypothetical protein CK203_102183 [Vitis vinifera]|uniref:Uncharacterized protein n=1 Tax=Vitis vinifera TaxID=29760 RepID=A0A438F7F7_VITVI|nr:hypothetical protein CK203_102183 [Vitis vinifera]